MDGAFRRIEFVAAGKDLETVCAIVRVSLWISASLCGSALMIRTGMVNAERQRNAEIRRAAPLMASRRFFGLEWRGRFRESGVRSSSRIDRRCS